MTTHLRVVQLSPIFGAFYRVVANVFEPYEPLFYKERILSMALVDAWKNDRSTDVPSDEDEVERTIKAVEYMDGYFDVNDWDNEHVVGYFWEEELADPFMMEQIKSSATKIREDAATRRRKKAAATS